MAELRKVISVTKTTPTLEGAGVRLHRVFGYPEVPKLDPFLLMDHFGSDDPTDYLPGFPDHPHRGIETVTYMIQGYVDHRDSLGNGGTIGSGDVQWMTAGSGIIHQEMPKEYEGSMVGFQLWVNLPKANKMMDPRYRDIHHSDIPKVDVDGACIKVIAGDVEGVKGPVQDLVVDVEYLDVNLPPGKFFVRHHPEDHIVFAYIFGGSAHFTPTDGTVSAGHLIIYGVGDRTEIIAGDYGARLILISGKPLNEPIAWKGPIVMNTDEELVEAFREYRDGTFIKKK